VLSQQYNGKSVNQRLLLEIKVVDESKIERWAKAHAAETSLDGRNQRIPSIISSLISSIFTALEITQRVKVEGNASEVPM
jgi:hypothetical protein